MTVADGAMGGGLVLGSARCGSTLVSQILRGHPDILSLSELFATAGPFAFRPARLKGARFWAHLARPSRGLSQVANPTAAPSEFLYGRVVSPLHEPQHDPWHCPPLLAVTLPHLSAHPDALFAQLAPLISARPKAAIADHYRALFHALSDEAGGRRVWVERSGGSLVAAGSLRAMFPEARLVVLLRHGPETALSMRDYPAARLAIWCWRRLRPLGIDLLDPRHHYGRGAIWPLVAAIGGRVGMRSILAQQPTVAEAGAFWSAVTQAGLAGLAGAAPLVLRYEDLCRDPRPAIEALGLHLAGRAPGDWLAASAALPTQRPSRLPGLSPRDRELLEAACAPGEAALRGFAG